jgi:hypothetical protein
MKEVYLMIAKEGFKKGKFGLNGYFFKYNLIGPAEYNINLKLPEKEFLNKYKDLILSIKLREGFK